MKHFVAVVFNVGLTHVFCDHRSRFNEIFYRENRLATCALAKKSTFQYLVRKEVQLSRSEENKMEREFSSDYLDLRKESHKMVLLCLFKISFKDRFKEHSCKMLTEKAT